MRTSTSPFTALALVGGLLGMSLAAACNDDTLMDRYPPMCVIICFFFRMHSQKLSKFRVL